MGRSKYTMAAAGLLATSISFPWHAVRAATLPIPCVAGVCGANNPFLATAGSKATATQVGSTLTVNQTSQNATLNWQSFNISADGTVNFVQPNSSAVALNRIFDANPTQIFGALNANGRVYLLNGNGIIFGAGAQVNVGSLIASTLNTTIDNATNNYSLLTPGVNGQAAFQQFVDPTSGVLLNHSVLIQQGATLQTPEGGQILVFAPTIVNQGTISTPGGQAVLAAGTQVYLASTDATIRGLLVEVAADNGIQTSVTNGNKAANANTTNPAQLVGQIVADRGNVTLAGLAVNQYGRVTATTSVNENGSIRLQAGTGSIPPGNGTGTTGIVQPGTGGTLTVGANSVTAVDLDTADTSTTVDSVAQPKSDIAMYGATIDVLNNSTVRATGGRIEALAAQNQGTVDGPNPSGLTSKSDGSRIYIAPGANLDVSGASVTLPVSSNIISAQLRGTELADSPLQQNGPLHGQTVYFDIRDHGTYADGTSWQGTPLANVSGEIAAIQRNVAERNLTGGTITLQSQGDVIVSPGSTLNISGGAINYTGGMVNTTMLLTTTGKSVPIGSADPNALYVGVLDGATVSDAKWGTTRTYGNVTGQYEQGYVQGMNAGTLNLSAPKFVLDGNVNGSTTAGIYQRLPTSAPIQGSTYFLGYDGQQDLYRNYDEVPKGATLNIGDVGAQVGSGIELVVGNVVLQSGDVLAGLRNADGSVFNPLTDPLPASYVSSVLRPDLLGGQSGFSQVSILTDGHFLQPATTDLRLPAGGSFAVEAGTIDIEGSIDAPGGTISASAVTTATSGNDAVSLTLGAQAALTARGEWVNDSASLYGGGTNTAPLYTAGGKVTLSATANLGSASILTLAPGSLIDVSGGAQLTSTGTLVDGAGGTITLAANSLGSLNNINVSSQPDQPAQVELGATLRGYGLSEGGKLNLSAGAVCVAAADCSTRDLNTLWLTPAFFSTGGFSSYAITANQGGLTVAPGVTLLLQQQNTELASNYARLGNSETLPVLSTPVLLPDLVRGPVDLTLTQDVAPNLNVSNTGGNANVISITPDTPSLLIGAGAVIAADPGASLTLASNSRIIVDGTLSAPGGSISLGLATTNLNDYAPTQGIWVGTSGVLDVHGVPQIQISSTGLRSGTVLNGGNVSITASDGYIELLPGSLIDVSGGTGTVDVVQFARPARSEQVGSAGGSVTLNAQYGMVLGGTFKAAGGAAGSVGAQPAGGSLTVELNYSGGGTLAQQPPNSDTPLTSEILVSQSLAPLIVAPGSAVPVGLGGVAYVPADAVTNGGFDSLTLQVKTYNPVTPVGAPRTPGEIVFNGNVNLDLGQEITFDAGLYSVSPGATAQIHAPYVEFGNSDQVSYQGTTFQLPVNLQLGSGTLDVSGGFIELYGFTALQGIGRASFDSTADLRLTGLQNLFQNTVAPLGGGLFTAGNLELSAGQIYPSTLSQFAIAAGVQGVPDTASPTSALASSITINPSPTANTNTDLLSAGGAVTLYAGTVNQQGVLRAPFGTIDIEANTINLASGSLTSTSANGLTVPFGTTQGGFDWVYTLLNSVSIVYGTDGVPLPAQHVILNGANVNIKAGAVVDVSGGGDLQAYEWIPGVGGTNDVLSQAVRPHQFAILPGLKANVAPYDPSMSAADGLQVGQSVYLSGAPGLPAGNYILLPARYALLPGAFLVSATSGYQDLQPGQTYSAPGGGTIVSGYATIAGTPFGASRTSGFTVVPASIVLGQAQYTTTGANQFFTSQAAAAKTDPSRLPQDSGILDLLASASLSLDGSLRADPAKQGLGAAVDISSSQIVIGTNATTPVQSGQLLVTTDSLDQLGAQTLLIGGRLSSTGAITTVSQSVTVASGANLTAPEVLLTATDQLTVSDRASVTASGTTAKTRAYTLSGDSAFLSVAGGPQATVTHTGEDGKSGVLTLAAGSSLTANQGSIYLDASENVVTQGAIAAAGGDLALQSTHIAVGDAPSSVSGTQTVLDPNLLTTSGLRNVLLSSSSTIDFYGSVSLSAQNLTLDAPGISGYGASGDAATASASGTLTLTNSHPVNNSQGTTTTPTPGSGLGSLTLNAANIDLGAGSLAVTGFNTLALNAQDTVTGTATGSLTTTGNLAVTASQLTTAAGVSTALTANKGAVTLLSPSQVAILNPVTALGGSLTVKGASIELGTQIVMPSGSVSLETTGNGTAPGSDLVLDSGAGISVAGITRQYNGVNVPTPGGTISLTSAGNVSLASGSTIDVSAATGGTGGSLGIAAPTGTVTAAGSLLGSGAGAQGASFSVDARSFDFASLNGTLASGFSGARGFRLRGDSSSCAENCNLVVASGTTIAAHSISLEADNGNVEIDGSLNASGTSGGSVALAASNNITVNGTIGANATAAGGKGGRVELDLGTQSTGSLQLNAGSVINVAGGGPDSSGDAGAGGTVLLRVPGALVLNEATNGGTGIVLAGGIQGSTRTTLEAVNVYSNAAGGLVDSTGIISTADIANINTDITNFMANQSLVSYSAKLGQALGSKFFLEPGVEIDGVKTADDSTGALQLNTAWNLYDWRFGSGGNIPGVLTLRASGGVTFNASLSDGFTSTTSFTLPTTPTDSWSYRIVAGADLTAASPLTVSTDPTANVQIAACSGACTPGTTGRGGSSNYAPNMVRTGNGFIDVSASGDFMLGSEDDSGNWLSGSQSSLLYTAGVAGPGLPITGRSGSLQGLAYPTDGGDINITVNGNVDEQAPTQFVNAWLWRVGATATQPSAWTVNFQSFQQGVGALGGGDVLVRAGGDVTNLSVSIPTVGMPVGSTLATSTLQVAGGGSLTVDAGGSILGGSYYTGLGTLALNAGGDVGPAAALAGGTTFELAPLLGLGTASATVTARGNIQLAGIVNPSLLDSGAAESATPVSAWFSTYGASSSVNLLAVGGNVTLDDESQALGAVLGASFSGGATAFSTPGDSQRSLLTVLPPTLNVDALSGNIDISSNLTLTPAPTGNLQLFADQNVNVAALPGSVTTSVQIELSDADPALLPTAVNPTSVFSSLTALYSASQHAAVPVHSGDPNAAMIVARTGDVDFANSTNQPNSLVSAKPVQIVAGLDVRDLNLVAQNLLPSDVTSITAGQDIIYPQSRLSTTGILAPDTNAIVVGGPGQVELTAGRNINFGTSGGLTTVGNLDNPSLPTGGASATLLAGIAGNPLQVSAFITKYIDGTTDFDQELVSFVEGTTGSGTVDPTQAKQIFGGMSQGLQTAFVEQVFFDLLRTNGRSAAAAGPTHNNFSGAYTALQTLFPGANPNLSAGETDPYAGDILLYFSKVYTNQGGNISLLAPGGQINAGLAQPPSAFGVGKTPDQLGIVVQTTGSINAFSYGDFQVNQSRVFASDGGNILVWSTEGNIDAGRGSKTSLSAAPATVTIDPQSGAPIVTLSAPLTGSGIQALATSPGATPGDVDLFAPHGVVNANDAGIVAGNLTIAATAVLGTNNIVVTGTSVGVPVPVTGLGAAAVGASSSAASAMATSTSFSENRDDQSKSPAADTALGWLDVFVLGFGEETCKAEDAECMKRQSLKQ
jgi:filamentous hemagglutinin